jgi:hypothetical protein
MEVYSPKKFKSASFSKNEINISSKPDQEIKESIRFVRVEKAVKSKEESRGETMNEWMKRVFYERLRAFFEYEEVP